ncbi:UDP-glucose 4-epimerase [Trinickia diaoshuihuensis]|jgi:hypothetical protein|uniref:UDP-glucose 4-epimerase n=1 Tax=Trinickia diaoshuihuensis TaxID=2292265 RepID=UPI000E223EE4|nr:UDP-glucose 4-epimerase [Trinickia diaoshuihuensis]
MALSGSIEGPGWHVSAHTASVPDGFACTVRVAHGNGCSEFRHEFKHAGRHTVEREALLAALREGMMWIDHKMAQGFDF